MGARVDGEFARIRTETSEALGSITKEVSGAAHIERVRQQVAAMGHTVDARKSEAKQQQFAVSDKFDQLVGPIKRMLRNGTASDSGADGY